MTQVVQSVMLNLDYMVLIFLRVTALMVSSPIFGRRVIPNVTKIGLCLLLTYIVFTVNPVAPDVVIKGVWHFFAIGLLEFLFGAVLGWVTTLFFSVVQTAGYVIDMQMGFGMVNVFDVQNNISVPMMGNFLYIVLTVVFFLVNGHHRLIDILMGTFATVPVGQVRIDPKLGLAALQLFAGAFLLVVQVALPFIASGLLGELILGFVVRTTPQMNVFVVGIPLKILLGFLMMALVLPLYVPFSSVIFSKMFEAVNTMLLGLTGAS